MARGLATEAIGGHVEEPAARRHRTAARRRSDRPDSRRPATARDRPATAPWSSRRRHRSGRPRRRFRFRCRAGRRRSRAGSGSSSDSPTSRAVARFMTGGKRITSVSGSRCRVISAAKPLDDIFVECGAAIDAVEPILWNSASARWSSGSARFHRCGGHRTWLTFMSSSVPSRSKSIAQRRRDGAHQRWRYRCWRGCGRC